MQTITQNEILEVLREAEEGTDDDNPEGATTVKELAKIVGCSKELMRERLLPGIENGTIGVVRVRAMRIDGTPTNVPGYYVKK